MLKFKVSKDNYNSRCVDWENLVYKRWNSIKNHAHRKGWWSIHEEAVRHQMT